MDAKIGDRLVVESERVGQHEREGEILEVMETPYGTRYRVRWDEDGTETTIRPAAGAARVVHTGPPAVPAP